jgi:hypothetical protein
MTDNPKITNTIEDITDWMQECEQQSLHGIFLRMMLKKAILAEFRYVTRRETNDKNIWEWFYEPKKGAPYFLMRVTMHFNKKLSMNIDYNPELVVNNEL